MPDKIFTAAQPAINFIQYLKNAIEKNVLIKITLGNKRDKNADVKNVFIKPVSIKNTRQLSFVYRYSTKDITKNFDEQQGLLHIEALLTKEFFNADLFTAENDFYLSAGNGNKIKLVTKPPTLQHTASGNLHDRQKNRLIKAGNNVYLHALGLTTADGIVKKDMQDKYKQVNRYVEIIEGIIKEVKLPDAFNVVDMGSGKGYLTFALYDYLQQAGQSNATVTGIELRKELVEKCSAIAAAAGFKKLFFNEGSIEEAEVNAVDMLIALHACDTATDDAIYKGIKAGASIIVCAPCCQKQIRQQMAPGNALQYITQHGILLERQAEMVTDSIRALLMEANGYKTKIFDFIATEHTPKNILIVGTKRSLQNIDSEKILRKVKALKELFGIKEHYLEKLLQKN